MVSLASCMHYALTFFSKRKKKKKKVYALIRQHN